MKNNLWTCETMGETKANSRVRNCPTMRLPREACRLLIIKFQVHLLGAGSLGYNQLLLLQLGSGEPPAPDKFLPWISGRSFPIFSLLVFSDKSVCTAGDGIWHACSDVKTPCSDVKTPCPDVLIPCGNPLHHTWPPMAWFDKVNDYCATEVTYAHWSLQRAHKRVPPPLLMQLNAFYLEICTICVQFSHPPHTNSLH